MTSLTGVVLAGGRSSRMGRDKALLRLHGVTLLDRAVAMLRSAGATDVIVSGARPCGLGVADREPGRGPLGGVATVLPQCPDGRLLVMPVDMPGVSGDDLAYLLGALEDSPAARFGGHPLPWGARVDATLRARAAELLAGPPASASMRALHGAVGGIDVPVPVSLDLRNVNTPDEWTAFSADLR